MSGEIEALCDYADLAMTDTRPARAELAALHEKIALLTKHRNEYQVTTVKQRDELAALREVVEAARALLAEHKGRNWKNLAAALAKLDGVK